MENIRMVDEAFLLARINKLCKGGGSGDGPSREEFNSLVERVNGAFLIAEYGVTPAEDILSHIEAEGDFAPVLIKRGNDLYTSLLASKKNDNAVYLRAIGSGSGKYYIFDYTVTGSTWASKSYGLQELLESGVNIKTINGDSILGAGNIDIQGGGGDSVFIAEYGVTEYEDIEAAIAADNIIIIHDPEMIPEGGSAYLIVTRAEALEGTAVLNVYGAKTFGRYQIGMGRWVKSWEPLGGGVFKAVWGETSAQELLEALNNEDVIMVYNRADNFLRTVVFADRASYNNTISMVLNGSGPYGSEGYGNGLSQVCVRVTDNVWEEVNYVRVYPDRKAVGEQVRIGSYNDGAEEYPMYRKIVDIGTFPNAGEKSVPHGIAGNFTVTSLTGIMRQSTGNALPLPLVTLDTSKMVYISCGRTNVVVQTGSDRSAFTGTVEIEYYIA